MQSSLSPLKLSRQWEAVKTKSAAQFSGNSPKQATIVSALSLPLHSTPDFTPASTLSSPLLPAASPFQAAPLLQLVPSAAQRE